MQQKQYSKFLVIKAYIKREEIPNKQHDLTPQGNRKGRPNYHQRSRRKGTTKIRVEIKDKENRKAIEKNQ